MIMGFGSICFFCQVSCSQIYCDACLTKLVPSFRFLPSLPNIALGGYLFDYSDPFKAIMSDVKFHSNFKLADWLKQLAYVDCIPQIYLDVDAVLCVPSHWFRQIIRGRRHIPYLFNQLLHQTVDGSCFIKRIRFNLSSYRLNRFQRQQNTLNSRFQWQGPKNIQSVTILDDICTTGTTVIEIARLLKMAGVKTIYVLTLSYQSL
tara:strand:- start:221 stop:832 length:612 start_codon:yes stop_codon:yes gene_type:complete